MGMIEAKKNQNGRLKKTEFFNSAICHIVIFWVSWQKNTLVWLRYTCKSSTSMTNITLNYDLEDLNVFTPELKGWRLYLFTASSMATAIISLVTQITVYRSLKRLGPRHINQMIIPSQVSKIALIDIWNCHISKQSYKGREKVQKVQKIGIREGPWQLFTSLWLKIQNF